MTRSEFDQLIEEPYLYANLLGFDLITPFHNEWISKLAWRDEDYTLQAHRDSYKTTCLIVAVTMVMVLRPSETTLLLRKESGSTIEFIIFTCNLTFASTATSTQPLMMQINNCCGYLRVMRLVRRYLPIVLPSP